VYKRQEILGITASTIRSRFADWPELQPETPSKNCHLWKPADVRRFLRRLAREGYTHGRPSKIDAAAAEQRLDAWLGK
jgi:hypothetical protein